MACDAVFDYVTRETGRFSTEIYNRIFPRSPWVGLVRRDSFPEGMGETISNLTYERSAPTDAEPEWTSMAVVAGQEGGICLPTATKIAVASTTRSYSLNRRVLEGPDFCAEELRTPFAVAQQLNNILNIITEYSLIEWEIRYRHDYLEAPTRKVVVPAGGTSFQESTGTGFPAACPGSILTQGVLNVYKGKLLRDGAIMSALGRENGAAILTLITDAETSDRLIFENADIRQDLRWGKPNELLAPYYVERSYRGFYHLIDHFPMRFTCSGGVYTEVPAFITTAATKGNKAIVNPDYESAPYTTSIIFDRTVFTSRIPKPVISPGGGLKFDPVNYMGRWQLKNIPDRVCNPDGTIAFHRGHLAEGAEPVHPERGVLFVHKRCDPSLNLVTSCT